MAIIGIDLGTTNSLVSILKEEGVQIIPNVYGENLTPSIVSVDEEGQVFVGKIARERLITHPNNTVSVFKRNMGSKKEYDLGCKKFLPEELSALVIKSLKEDAQKFLNEDITEAVISVPAYFNDAQRKATQRAGELAGLKVERLINEPTAAAIAYGLHEKNPHTKFLIFDLGGGTFDISILEKFKNVMEVRAVAGDNFLGGEDFTEILVNIFLANNKLNVEDLENREVAMLVRSAENAKKEFSNSKNVTISAKIKGELVESKISIDDYEKQCEMLLAKLRRPIDRALSDASIKVREIDSIVLVGGATKLPIIRGFVSKLFGRLPAVNINPDEVVALGAGIQGAMKERNKLIADIVLTDVCPYTLGTNISVMKPGGFYESGHFCPIIERNSIIPISRTERLYTVKPNQKKITVEILQGESRRAKENVFLGELVVQIPPSTNAEEAIDVRYTYDINGILEVEVTVVSTGDKKRIVIEKSPGHMSKEEIETRLKELSELKIHPKEKDEYKYLLAKGERLYEESIGINRRRIAAILEGFETVLDKQDDREISKSYSEVKELLNEIEAEMEFE
ncbi:MAG: Hsp70 family protein [Clostridium sp.]